MNENQFDQSIRLCPSLNQITSEYTSPCLLHSHKQWEFTIFLEGKYLNRINGKDYIAVANRVFILGPAHSHALTQLESKNRYRDIYIENKKLYDIVLMFFGKSLMRRLCNTENPICFDLSPQCLTELQPRLKALTSISRIDSDYNSQRQIADSIIVYLLGKLIVTLALGVLGQRLQLRSQCDLIILVELVKDLLNLEQADVLVGDLLRGRDGLIGKLGDVLFGGVGEGQVHDVPLFSRLVDDICYRQEMIAKQSFSGKMESASRRHEVQKKKKERASAGFPN